MKIVASAIVLILAGCAGRVPIQPPHPPIRDTRPDLSTHLLGTWELPASSGPSTSQMLFEPDGRLVFRGGLTYLNPARWTLDSTRNELKLSFPNTPDEKIQIFKLYVGDGVKAFDRPGKEVTYAFDAETWTLHVAGWPYTKPQTLVPTVEESEPILK
jgi:hypothetical protein